MNSVKPALIAALALALAQPAAASVELYTGGFAVVDDPYSPPRLVNFKTERVNELDGSGGKFAIGSGFATATPIRGHATFDASGGTIDGHRVSKISVRTIEVHFRSAGATLAGTLMIPPGGGRRAAVAYVTGSGPTTREYLPELQALFLHAGLAVLAYDKRGIGASGGTYAGESPTADTIDVLARDAEAATRFLARRPEIDPLRVGLAGHSQAGWIMPLAATREPSIRYLVVFSGPAVTADENDLYQTLAGEGEQPQTLTNAAIDAKVARAGRSGVDPIPWIRRLHIPALWLYGGLDHIVPPRLSAERILAVRAGHDFTVATFPRGNHALVQTSTGLTSEMIRSDRYAHGLFARVTAWLRVHRLS